MLAGRRTVPGGARPTGPNAAANSDPSRRPRPHGRAAAANARHRRRMARRQLSHIAPTRCGFRSIPRTYYRELPKLTSALRGYPRVYALAVTLIALRTQRSMIYVLPRAAFQGVAVLVGELWAVPIMLQTARSRTHAPGPADDADGTGRRDAGPG